MQKRYATSSPPTIPFPDLIVWDLDGTLTKTGNVIASIASASDKMSVPLSKLVARSYELSQKVLETLKLRLPITDALKNRIIRKIASEREDVSLTILMAYSSRVPCVLLSNGPEAWGKRILNRLGYGSLFDMALFREQTKYLKPDPRSFTPILDNYPFLKPDISTIWVIGDRASDVQLAQNITSKIGLKTLPIAMSYTKAAEEIVAMNKKKNGAKGHIIDDQKRLWPTLSPQYMQRLDRYLLIKTDTAEATCNCQMPKRPLIDIPSPPSQPTLKFRYLIR